MLIYIDAGHRIFPRPLSLLHTITNSLEEYLASTTDKKIAITFERFGYHHSIMNYQDYVDQLKIISSASQAVFIIESELHNDNALISTLTPSNVYWSLPGVVNANINQTCNADFFNRIRIMYAEQLPTVLDTLIPYNTKSQYFDALLGETKPHRTFVYNSINKNQLEKKCIISYRPNQPHMQFYDPGHFILEPGTEILNTVVDTAGHVKYFDVPTALSYIIPIQVYNQTAYSIVAETDYHNEFSFFTEKTAKPIMARRLFVVFSGRNFLHNLRQLGFRTFNGIIDESYDLIEDTDTRFAQAFDQVKFLCSQPQEEILESVKPIVEHNYNLLKSTNFTLPTTQKLIDIIYANN